MSIIHSIGLLLSPQDIKQKRTAAAVRFCLFFRSQPAEQGGGAAVHVIIVVRGCLAVRVGQAGAVAESLSPSDGDTIRGYE